MRTARPRARQARSSARDAGQSLIELALILPVLVFGLAGGIDFARSYAAYLGAMNAARAGAEASVMGSAANDAAAIAAAQDELQRIPAENLGRATVTVAHTTSGGNSFTSVRVQYSFQTIVAWPFVPSSSTIDRTVTFRAFP